MCWIVHLHSYCIIAMVTVMMTSLGITVSIPEGYSVAKG